MSAQPHDHVFDALSYRSFDRQDVPTIARIEREVYAFPWSEGNFIDSVLSGYQCVVCCAHGEIIGYAVVMYALDEAHLLNFALSAHWHGQGVGSAFLRRILELARAEHKETIYLEVRPSNVAGRSLYARFGFREIGLRREYYPAVGGREDALFLALSLAPSPGGVV